MYVSRQGSKRYSNSLANLLQETRLLQK